MNRNRSNTVSRLVHGAAVLLALMVLSLTACDRSGIGRKDEDGRAPTEAAGRAADADQPGTENVAYRDDVGTVFAVNTTQAVEGEILNYLQLNGDVVTESSVDVFPDTGGKLTGLSVALGQYVRKDQVIAEVDPSKPGMTYVPGPVKSPISGTVIEIPVDIGDTVSPATSVARISKMNQLEIRTFVSERFISKISLGLEALLSLEAYPEESFRARVTRLSPVVDPQSRTMEVRLRQVRPDPRIKAGMFAEIKIITERKQGIVKVPSECMVRRYGGYYLFVVHEESWVEKRKVTPGIEIDQKLEIVEGLEPGEQVVIRGQTLLEDTARVRVIDRIQPLEADDVLE